MKIKSAVVIISAAALLCAAVLIIALKQNSISERILVVPLNLYAPSFSINKIEDFCEDESLVTYKIENAQRITHNNIKHDVNIIGTNSVYPILCGKTGLSYKYKKDDEKNYTDVVFNGMKNINGSFWTKTGWTEKNRKAVLNKSAAMALFGSTNAAGLTFTMQNKIWQVAGVFDDGSDAKNLYVPSSISGGSPTVLLALTDKVDYTFSRAKTALKTLGTHSKNNKLFQIK